MAIDACVTSDDVLNWAERRVNLSASDAKEYRAQGNRLRDKLATYIDAHPDYNLVKTLNSGSVAKRAALRSTSDLDVGVYVRVAQEERDPDLVGWLEARILEAYGDAISRNQVSSDDTAVKVEFVKSGVIVECVPILYDDEPDDYGYLLLRSGDRVHTSISKHLDFFQKRKDRFPSDFVQWVRLLRYWRLRRAEEGAMPLSSFSTELIAAHLLDNGTDPRNFPAAMQAFFSFIVKGGLRKQIVFTDNYSIDAVQSDGKLIQIFDPVSFENNTTYDLSASDLDKIVETASEALDDCTIARTATTKERAVDSWRDVFGPEFNV